MITALLATAAMALTPSWEARVHAASDDGHHAELRGFGLGGGVGLPVWGDRLDLEAGLDLGLSLGPEPRADLWLGARPWLTPRAGEVGALSLALAVGAGVAGGQIGPRALMGAAVDLPSTGRLRWRVQGHYLVAGLDPAAAHLRVGAVWGPKPPPPEPEPEPEPVAEPAAPPEQPPESLSPPPPPPAGDATVWSPWPECTWTPLTQAGQSLADLDPDQQVQVGRPGYLPVTVRAGDAASVELEPAPAQGSLVVLAHAGDVVEVGGHKVSVVDGVAVLNASAGPVDVVVTGGGRTWEARPAIAEGYAIWLRVPEPPPLEAMQKVVLFAVASYDITPTNRALLVDLVQNQGDWDFRIQGSHSPEGDADANRKLAANRGKAVVRELKSLGVPARAIEVLEPSPPADGLTMAEQRRVVVWLEPPGGE